MASSFIQNLYLLIRDSDVLPLEQRIEIVQQLYTALNSPEGRKLLRDHPSFAALVYEKANEFCESLSLMPSEKSSLALKSIKKLEQNNYAVLKRRYNLRSNLRKPIRYR